MRFENYAEYIETYEYLYNNKMIGLTGLCKAKSNAFFKMGNIHSVRGDKNQALKNYLASLKYGIPVPLHFLRLWRNLKPVQHNSNLL